MGWRRAGRQERMGRMEISLLLAVSGITFLAFVVKAATGFGPALVVVSLGSLLVGPANAVILAAFLDLASGAGLAWLDRARIRGHAWWARAAVMSAGAVVGSLLLGVIPTATLTGVVAAGVVAFGAWMLVAPLLPGDAEGGSRGDRRGSTVAEHAVVAAAGLSGGLIGIGGPPLILYYGTRLSREAFRAMIVPILLAAAVVRTLTYAATGQVDRHVLLLFAASLPALPLGLALGNRVFQRWSERSFRIAVAALVTAAGLRMLLQAVT